MTWEERKKKAKAFQDAGKHVEAVAEAVEEVYVFVKKAVCVRAGLTPIDNFQRPMYFSQEVLNAGITPEERKQLAEMYYLRAFSCKVLGSINRALPELEAADFLYDSKDVATRKAIDECVEIQRLEEEARMTSKIPVTILTGFLGSGKTTLLNRILRTQHGKRYAVIENELGAISIDNQLLEDDTMKKNTKESITVLDNGCLCCTVRDDLVKAIKEIVTKADYQASISGKSNDVPPLDGILIETTGMADPGPICKTFWADDELHERCKMDGVLTLVDSKHFLIQLKRERSKDAVNESAQQVAFADKVVCNKIDLVSPSEAEEIESVIKSINTTAPVLRCSLEKRPDEFSIEEIMGMESFSLDKVLKDLEEPAEPSKKKQKTSHGDDHGHGDGHGHGSGHGEGHGDSQGHEAGHGDGHGHGAGHGGGHGHGGTTAVSTFRHDTGVGTCAIHSEGEPLDLDRFTEMLKAILGDGSANLYRYKGVVCIREKNGDLKRFVLQGVHDQVDFKPRGTWPQDKPIKNQLVFIGRKLEKELWERLFNRCKVSVAQDIPQPAYL
eukprot:gnl/MRDRNA2_/MRDRNA2_34820_c0_seq1.p1 gnl/MRDRNA2_/MRDRNA2_34820_c0~~gnl/MRDRNA2_/MRDRNA2_34820_c0_seq1.p1  ORF type:complete len:555 (-),score=130.62 gnl/MRDRNA2_/MRDRNA2_34820_c0_seq1:28-1692(-)